MSLSGELVTLRLGTHLYNVIKEDISLPETFPLSRKYVRLAIVHPGKWPLSWWLWRERKLLTLFYFCPIEEKKSCPPAHVLDKEVEGAGGEAVQVFTKLKLALVGFGCGLDQVWIRIGWGLDAVWIGFGSGLDQTRLDQVWMGENNWKLTVSDGPAAEGVEVGGIEDGEAHLWYWATSCENGLI